MSGQDKQVTSFPGQAGPAGVAAPDPMRVLPTPLFMKTSEASQTNSWTEWNGYTVPALCTTHEDECRSLFHDVVLADISSCGKYEVSGPGVRSWLCHLIAGFPASPDAGEVISGPMCHSSGKVIDLVTVALFEEDRALLTMANRCGSWLMRAASGFEVSVADLSDQCGGFLLAGPSTASQLLDADLGDCTDLVLAGCREIVYDGLPVRLVHHVNDAVPGLAVFAGNDDIAIIWNRLHEAGETEPGVIGMQTLDSLRIEGSEPAEGRDFVSGLSALRHDRARSALELGFSASIDFEGPVFNGRAALLEEAQHAEGLRLARLSFPDGLPESGARLVLGEGRKAEVVGFVTSTSAAPYATSARGLGFVSSGKVREGDILTVQADEVREIMHLARPAACRVTRIRK